jgi:hypothetical protein
MCLPSLVMQSQDEITHTQQTELNDKEIELIEIIEKEDEQREFDEKSTYSHITLISVLN